MVHPRNPQQVWISAYLLAGLLILTTVKKYSFPNLLRSLQFGFSFQAQRKFERIELGKKEIFPQLLNVFYVLNVSFLAFSVNSTYGLLFPDRDFLFQVLFFMGLTLTLLLIKSVSNLILVAVTSKGKFINEYQIISGNMNRISGLFIFPIMLLFGFSEMNSNYLVILALVLMGSLLLIKWAKGILLSLGEEGLGILQILTYFCALEILPHLVLVKFTIETFKAG